MESVAILPPTYVPPNPSCRRPLSRMTDRSSKIQTHGFSKSPKAGDNIAHHQPDDDLSDMSSNENEEDRITDDSFNKDSEHPFNRNPKNQGTPKKGSSPSNRLKTPKSNSEVDGTKQPATPGQSSKSKSSEKETTNSLVIKGVIVSAFIGIIAYFVCFGAPPWTVEKDSPIKFQYLEEMKKFKESIKEIKGTFPSQDRATWIHIESGMNELINGSQKPWIFVLYSNETRQILCLAKMLGNASSKALNSKEMLELHPHDMGDDYGLAIDRWGSAINLKKAVVVYDLLKINPRAIQAFHTMCDRESPLVKSAVYILTIITSGNIPQFESPFKYVENQLTNQFTNKIPVDKLQPLVTRLMDGPIISVKPEIDFAGCPL